MDGTAIADEFAGCTLEDVALAVGYSAPGSEDHALALDALRRRLPPGRDHNQPPIGELLDEELLPFKRRRDELVRVAETAVITDDESAAKTLDLAQLCKAFEDEIEARRKQLVKPHRDAEKAINDRHTRLRLDVQVARQGMNGVSGLRGLLTKWDDRKKVEAEQARLKAEREAAAKEIAAASAREQLEKAAATGRGVVSAELTALRLQDEADHARVEAEAIQAGPTRSHLGQVSRRKEIVFDIVDIEATLKWSVTNHEILSSVSEAMRNILYSYLRALGVSQVEKGIEIPGVSIKVELAPVTIRR